jgi:glycosyltransferase involved in cell wall biosynthesis
LIRSQPFIVIDGRMILAHMTGAGRYLLGLCTGLNGLTGDERIELWLQPGLPADHPVWDFTEQRIMLRTIPAAHFSLRGQWELPGVLRRTRPDLIHYPHFDLPWLTPGRVIATLYDLKYVAHPEFFPTAKRLRRWIIWRLTSFTLHRACRVIVPSQNTAYDLVARLKADKEKLHVIPLGVDQRYFSPPQPEAISKTRRCYGLEAPFVLFVGERRPHKNLDGLLRAFDIFRRSTSRDYHLVIAGRPYPGYNLPEALAETLELSDRVHFLGNVPESDLPTLYRCADSFVLLSHYEGFGLPVLEAMACGTPVVISNVTSLPEVAGEAGMKVPPDDPQQAAAALMKVIPGGNEREKCIASGLEQARRFTWDRCAQMTMQVYRKALGK